MSVIAPELLVPRPLCLPARTSENIPMLKFSATIFKIGINPVVDPPVDVLSDLFEQVGKSKGAIPVCGRLNGAEFIQTLVKYQGLIRRDKPG